LRCCVSSRVPPGWPVTFWRLACSDGDLIGELYQQLCEGEISFEQLAQQLRDPELAGRSLGGLLVGLQLSDSASTRQAFARQYGCSPADFRRGAMARVPL
jgi:hypothetical protein